MVEKYSHRTKNRNPQKLNNLPLGRLYRWRYLYCPCHFAMGPVHLCSSTVLITWPVSPKKQRCSKGRKNQNQVLSTSTVPFWNVHGHLVPICIWPHFVLCCRLLVHQENVSSAWDFNTKPIVSSHSLCQSWQSQVLDSLKKVIHHWMERMPKLNHTKAFFLHILKSEDPVVPGCNANQHGLPDLTDSWVTTQGHPGPFYWRVHGRPITVIDRTPGSSAP